MPHSPDRKATKREAVPLRTGNDNVRLQEQRRFFSSRGNNSSEREARLIADAFDIGTKVVAGVIESNNVKGEERAIEEAGSGTERNLDDKNSRYNKTWDLLDDKRSLSFARVGLAKILQEAGGDDLEESQVQDITNQFLQDQFLGIDKEAGDHTFLAEGLLQLETEVLVAHKDSAFQKIQDKQMADAFADVKESYANSFEFNDAGVPVAGTGTAPYDDIANYTGTFLSGSAKMTAYWEMIYDLAIESGDPDVIRNAPEKFANGDPTGINDTRRADEHRAAIKSATIKQATNALAAQEATDKYNDDLIFGLQVEIFKTRQEGGDPSALIDLLAANPNATLSDITSAKNFGDSQLSEKESRSANLSFTTDLWQDIYDGGSKSSDLFDAVMEGEAAGLFGNGPQAAAEMVQMMSAIKSIADAGASLRTQSAVAWKGQINNRYNAKTGGLLEPINPVMQRINVDANQMYLEAIESGTQPDEAYNKVIEKFDPMVQNLPPISKEELANRRSQSDFTGKTSVSLEVIGQILSNDITVRDAFLGVPDFVVQDRLLDEVDNGNLMLADALLINGQL